MSPMNPQDVTTVNCITMDSQVLWSAMSMPSGPRTQLEFLSNSSIGLTILPRLQLYAG